jgi:hypothetical protein
MTSKKAEPALFLDMDFGEALARYAQTKPEEVTPAPGQKPKSARPKPGAPKVPKASAD